MNYESELETILYELLIDKQVCDALDCIEELNEKYNMKPAFKAVMIGGVHPYAAFEFENGEIIIIGPPLKEFGKQVNIKTTKELYENRCKELANEWALNQRWNE